MDVGDGKFSELTNKQKTRYVDDINSLTIFAPKKGRGINTGLAYPLHQAPNYTHLGFRNHNMVATVSLMCNIHNMFAKFQIAPRNIASESLTILLVT